MLIGNSPRRPNLEQIRRIKSVLRDALNLSEDATVTVAELACLEEGCAPIETVIGLLRPDEPQPQHRLHRSTDDLDAQDIVEVCRAWGFEVQIPALAPRLEEDEQP